MLSHPNIVSVYDVSKGDDLDYIVMELIDGITLKQYMQKKDGQPELAGVPLLHHPDRPGLGPRPQPGDHPPGHQAPKHHGPAGRQRQSG